MHLQQLQEARLRPGANGDHRKKPSTATLRPSDLGLDVLSAPGGLAQPDPARPRSEAWPQSGQSGSARCSASRGCPTVETPTVHGSPGGVNPGFLPARSSGK